MPIEEMQCGLDDMDGVLLPVLYDERLDVADVTDVANLKSIGISQRGTGEYLAWPFLQSVNLFGLANGLRKRFVDIDRQPSFDERLRHRHC